jgi:ABC-type antimicrobial peptide transport system permease subunit
MNMVRLGIRNLLRSRSRLLFVTILIGVPFFLLLVMRLIGTAVEQQTQLLRESVDNTLQLRARGSMGHVNMVGNEDLLPKGTVERIRDFEHVAKVEPYLLAMTPTEGHNFAMVIGVNPGQTLRLESHGEAGNPKIIAGRNLTPEDSGKNVAVIGQGYAKLLGITPENIEKATLVLDLKRTHPVIFALDRPQASLRIVGIYASGYVFGDLQLFMPLDTFRDIYAVPDGQTSWAFVKTTSAAHLPQVEQRIRQEFGEVADIIAPTNVAQFQATATAGILGLSQGGTILSAALMIIVVFFVMLLVVRERAWEIGTLKALGASNGGIVLSFLAEALAFTATGAVLGLLLFVAWGGYVAQELFVLGVAPFLPPEYKDTLIHTLILSPSLGVAVLGLLATVSLGAALAGSAWSALQIIRLSPVEAMRHE